MLFGDYLVEKKVITEKQLLEGLLEQLERTPSYAMACFQGQLLEPHDLLNVLKKQQSEGLDFFSSARQLSVWSQEKMQQMTDILRSQRRPLGEILVETGALSLKDLSHHLDEYLAIAQNAKSTEPSESTSEKNYQTEFEAMINMMNHLGLLSSEEGFLFDSITNQVTDHLSEIKEDLLTTQSQELSDLTAEAIDKFNSIRSAGFEAYQDRLEVLSKEGLQFIEEFHRAIESRDPSTVVHLKDVLKNLHV